MAGGGGGGGGKQGVVLSLVLGLKERGNGRSSDAARLSSNSCTQVPSIK